MGSEMLTPETFSGLSFREIDNDKDVTKYRNLSTFKMYCKQRKSGEKSKTIEPAHAKRGLMAFFVEFEISTVSDVELSQKYASENRFQKYQACTKLWSIK